MAKHRHGTAEPTLAASRAWPRAVTLVSARDGAALHVITATAVVLAAMDPPILTVAVAATSRIRALAEAGRGFAVAVLAADGADLAERFAAPGRPADHTQLAGLSWDDAPVSGAPVLAHGVAAWFDCRLRGVVAVPGAPGQVLLAGRVAAAGRAPHTPGGALLRAEGAYEPFPPETGWAPEPDQQPLLAGASAGGR
ncbi:MAG: flavin reductase family protein [Kineosporiaceae bacterium]